MNVTHVGSGQVLCGCKCHDADGGPAAAGPCCPSASESVEERGCTTLGCRVLTYHARPPEFPMCPLCGFVGAREHPSSQNSPPSVDELVGIDPEYTGDLSTQEFLDRQRGDRHV